MFGFELVKSVDEDDLAFTFVRDLLEDAGKGIAQGGAALAGKEEVGEVVLEDEAGWRSSANSFVRPTKLSRRSCMNPLWSSPKSSITAGSKSWVTRYTLRCSTSSDMG
jgi:hypothetical protein